MLCSHKVEILEWDEFSLANIPFGVFFENENPLVCTRSHVCGVLISKDKPPLTDVLNVDV